MRLNLDDSFKKKTLTLPSLGKNKGNEEGGEKRKKRKGSVYKEEMWLMLF
jgi:hypothetical protein